MREAPRKKPRGRRRSRPRRPLASAYCPTAESLSRCRVTPPSTIGRATRDTCSQPGRIPVGCVLARTRQDPAVSACNHSAYALSDGASGGRLRLPTSSIDSHTPHARGKQASSSRPGCCHPFNPGSGRGVNTNPKRKRGMDLRFCLACASGQCGWRATGTMVGVGQIEPNDRCSQNDGAEACATGCPRVAPYSTDWTSSSWPGKWSRNAICALAGVGIRDSTDEPAARLGRRTPSGGRFERLGPKG